MGYFKTLIGGGVPRTKDGDMIRSRHWSKRAADEEATAQTLATAKLGMSRQHSSGWGRIEYQSKKAGGLRRWVVVERKR